MSNLIINGGSRLEGRIKPAGNKNSVLPILCATLLTDENIMLRNVPDLTDVNKLVENIIQIGGVVEWNREEKTIRINNKEINRKHVGKELPIGMRGAVLLFAPLLHRLKEIEYKSEIGGCALGIREIDTHLDVLKELGADIKVSKSLITMKIKERFSSADLWQDYMSVTTTENFVMASVLAKGVSTMTNAASEPHVQDLCNFLNSMGAKISGIGSSKLIITGVDKLRGTDFKVTSDHHEITTLLALGAMTGGRIEIEDAIPQHFKLINNSFKKLGVNIEYDGDTAIVQRDQEIRIAQPYTTNMLPKIEAAPWPYFPVDLLPLMVALSVKAKGSIMFWNKVYEGGLFWIPEMNKFGSQIILADPHRIIVYGDRPLTPATVTSPNIIRVAVALMMVALSIKGESVVQNADSIKRAHQNFIENLQKLGADIHWE